MYCVYALSKLFNETSTVTTGVEPAVSEFPAGGYMAYVEAFMESVNIA